MPSKERKTGADSGSYSGSSALIYDSDGDGDFVHNMAYIDGFLHLKCAYNQAVLRRPVAFLKACNIPVCSQKKKNIFLHERIVSVILAQMQSDDKPQT